MLKQKVKKIFLCGVISAAFFSCNMSAMDIQTSPPHESDAVSSTNLIWDSETKVASVNIGEAEAHLSFDFTNISLSDIAITNVHTSCGCTTAQLPALPWIVASGTNGQIGITVNLVGKSGTLFKSVTIDTDKGSQVLAVKVAILPPINPVAFTTNQSRALRVMPKKQAAIATAAPKQTSDLPAAQAMLDPNRARSFQMARVDRQAVFKGDCANCHAKPAEGKYGKELFDSVCGVCHEAANRATMVPDLHHLKVPTSVDFWETWISLGKTNSLMPAFAQAQGGPLTKWQINSLAKYLTTAIPSHTNQFE
jgi:mono/diheme cytochrome c family protein